MLLEYTVLYGLQVPLLVNWITVFLALWDTD